MKLRVVLLVGVVLALLAASAMPMVGAQDAVELRMLYYSDGNEDVVTRDLLDRFEADNPDIRVVMDVVAYSPNITDNLPIQLAAGEAPDMGRVTQLGQLNQYYLDLTDYVADPAYWEENFGPYLQWLRPAGETEGIYGMHTQLTVTGPFINRTLFEQAGVDVPSDSMDSVTWDEWVAAATEVAEATGTPFAIAIDRSGHRVAGPAISLGATYLNDEGVPDVLNDAGFRAAAEMIVAWHDAGITPLEVWAGAGGTYAAANEFFVNGQLVMYMSGSWQIGQFAATIGDAFDWEAVPNPCGPAACTGMPGGAALVAFDRGEDSHPAEVARVLDYLASPEVIEEFHARTLFLPGHIGLAGQGVTWDTEDANAVQSLDTFTAQVAALDPLAYTMQAYVFNTLVFNAQRDRITQVIVGELSMDEAIQRMQEDIDQGLAAQ
jgi:alpha-1,4-digalacturonate transport system substrate-binding protein